MNYLTEHELYINIVSIVYIFCSKILFLEKKKKEGWCEKILRSGDAQGGLTNNTMIPDCHRINWSFHWNVQLQQKKFKSIQEGYNQF